MTFLPVVERELRVASRRRNTYWTRFFAALIGICVCAWLWLLSGDSDPQQTLSKNLFSSVAFFAFTYTLLAGVFVTADSLSEEKREGTLGLLFLTDLKGIDVVLGKLVATSVNSFYRLLAVLPILAIPLILGGLTASEFWRMALALTNTLFLSLAIGIFLSALSRSDRRAMFGTFSAILVVSGLLPLIGFIIAARNKGIPFNMLYVVSSPGFSFGAAFDKNYVRMPDYFWSSIAIVHAMAWGFLLSAGILARYSWQDKPLAGKKLVWRDRIHRWNFGEGLARIQYRTRLLDVNPFLWIANRNRLKHLYVYLILALLGVIWFWLYRKYRNDMLDPATYIPTAILLHTIIKIWVASEACRPLSQDRANGALELLLSTPMSVDDILRGQMLALKRQFSGPVSVVLLADFAMFLGGIHNKLLTTNNDWLMLCLVAVLMFIADLYTLSWVGMWLGLTSRKSNTAARGAVMRVMVLPWLIFIGFVTVTLLSNVGRSTGAENMMLGAWFIIGMLNNLFFFMWARTNLRQEFRTVATQRFDAPVSRSWWSAKRSTPQPVGEPVKAQA